ncbi:putative lipopolysaccharide heptosyltransferase III [Crenobacter sp. SG2305]|uniref:putative lipopolysaccharide heptosyltransferase III n=1 Tax=Crenobacter oryzisoli TaxID=3056844 RepID=UPI0025AA9998|nr:putative lipopolysaccharide heptosyltransferase III [Crenobacter sp. SG2305]MDN0084112.1 putative lipopolysaccharide heptosyltransferase III [Crenobacter sp. SG2305]
MVKLRFHGDVLLSSPVLSVLKDALPHAEIDALVYRETGDMISGHPALSQLFAIDKAWKRLGPVGHWRAEWRLLQQLKARKYDLVVVLTEQNRCAWLVRLLKPRWSVGPVWGGSGRFFKKSFTFLNRLVPDNSRHIVELHLDALRHLGIYPAETARQLTMPVPAEVQADTTAMLQSAGAQLQRYIVVHPASRGDYKCWKPERVAEVINRLTARGEQVVLTAAPTADEQAMIAAIRQRLERPVLDLTGQLSLKQLAVVIDQAKLLLGVDSVPMHMAAAMQTPVVALFGPTSPVVWGPWQVPHRLVTVDMSCRPCVMEGCGNSRYSECIERITVEQVMSSIDSLLAETASSRAD